MANMSKNEAQLLEDTGVNVRAIASEVASEIANKAASESISEAFGAAVQKPSAALKNGTAYNLVYNESSKSFVLTEVPSG